MRAMLDRLVDLQKTDEKLVEFQSEEMKIPLEIEAAEGKIGQISAQIEEIDLEISHLSVQISELDRQLEEVKESSRRFQSRLLIVKTQREYQAVQREGESARKKRGDLEAEVKELRSDRSNVEASRKVLEEALEEEKASLGSIKKDGNKRLNSLKKQREDLEKTRTVEAGLIDPDLLARYQRVFNRYHGQGVVKLVKGVCHGCFMMVPPQLFNQVLAQEKVHQCPNCGRIIYADES